MKTGIHNPETLGLQVIYAFEESYDTGEYAVFMVWKHTSTGRLFWAQDLVESYEPFEDCYFLSPDETNLLEIYKESFDDFAFELQNFQLDKKQADLAQAAISDVANRIKVTGDSPVLEPKPFSMKMSAKTLEIVNNTSAKEAPKQKNQDSEQTDLDEDIFNLGRMVTWSDS